MKILDIQALLPETACGHTKCISLLDHKAPKYVWYPGVLEASLLQGEVFCILCSLVKPGWNGIKITYQKPTTDHHSTVFITSADKIMKTTSLCWTLAFNCIDQQWIHFSWVWLKVSSMIADILSNKQKVVANPQKLELTQTCFMVSVCQYCMVQD